MISPRLIALVCLVCASVGCLRAGMGSEPFGVGTAGTSTPSGRFAAPVPSRQGSESADVADVAEPQSSRSSRFRPRLPQLPSWLSLGRSRTSVATESDAADEPAPSSSVLGRFRAAHSTAFPDPVEPMQTPYSDTRQPPFDAPADVRRPRRPPPDPAPKPDQEAILASRRSVQDQPVADPATSAARSLAPDASPRDVVSQWVAKRGGSTPPVANPPERGSTAAPNQDGDAGSTVAETPAASVPPRLETWSDRTVSRAAEPGTVDAVRELPATRKTPTPVALPHAVATNRSDRVHPADSSPRRIPRVPLAAERTLPAPAPIVDGSPEHGSTPQTAADRSAEPISSTADLPANYPEGSWLATYERLVREAEADRPAAAPPAGSVKRSLRSRP
jgi:hypothetical protein